MTEEGADQQAANATVVPEGIAEVVHPATTQVHTEATTDDNGSSDAQAVNIDGQSLSAGPSQAATEQGQAASGQSFLTIDSDALVDDANAKDPETTGEAASALETTHTIPADTAALSSLPSSHDAHIVPSPVHALNSDAASEQEDQEFVPPDIEHIVSTGAIEDGASSMQALRELVAQARATSGQPREALPPGFGDDESKDSSIAPEQSQRGEKRKAEMELEELVDSSSGIDEVKAAVEKSQHPETKTLLQKALSSISGLVTRRPKVDLTAGTTTSGVAGESTAVNGQEEDSDSDSDSDSGSSSSASSDDDDEDDEDDAQDTSLVQLADDEDDDPSGNTVLATKNEILAPEVEQPTVQELSEADIKTLRKLGKVHSIVDSVVVIEQDVQGSKQPNAESAVAGSVPVDSTGRQGEREGEYSVLDTGSLLCFEDGKVLGLVFETFGSIHNPMYSIRFAAAAAIDRDLVKTGKPVFYVPAQSTYVLTQLLRSMKGSDASNMWDEEVAEDEIEYSDDEQEAEAKRRAKAIRSGKVDEQGNPLVAASSRGNKRQKHGAGQQSVPSYNTANGTYQQRPSRDSTGNSASMFHHQQSSHHRPEAKTLSSSLPQRNAGGSTLPLPPAPAAGPSLGPAFPHGFSSLPLKPIAGLPPKPNFQPDAAATSRRASSGHGSGVGTSGPHSMVAPSPRISTAEGSSSGLPHSRKHSAAANSLPAKPVDAVAAAEAAAAAAAMTSASPRTGSAGTQHRPYSAVAGASSPPHPPRSASFSRAAHAAPPTGTYPSQGSPGWYANAGSPPSSTPASPAARNTTHRPEAPQVGHYNPAYAAHWQQPFVPGSGSTPPAYSGAAMGWNMPQSYQSPATASQASYGGYGGQHGSYGATSGGGHWNGQTYPGSHYPGYSNMSTPSQHYPTSAATTAAGSGSHAHPGHYSSSAQAYGYGAYPSHATSTDGYNAYGYTAPGSHGAATPSQDTYDPRSPSMGSSSNNTPNQHGAGSQGR